MATVGRSGVVLCGPAFWRVGGMFVLRPLQVGDAEAVALLIRGAFASIDPPLQPAPSALRETVETIAVAIGKGGMAAVAEGRVVGAVLWEPRDGGLYFGRLAVDGAWRRLGVAQALVEAVEMLAREAGFSRVHAAVRLALAGNRAFFASLGFVETKLHAHEGFSAPTWVELEKHLGAV